MSDHEERKPPAQPHDTHDPAGWKHTAWSWHGELANPDHPVPDALKQNVLITTLDRIYNWSRARSVWPLFFGVACCAIEYIVAGAARYDKARFGMEVIRPTPRQADLMVVSGTVVKKMAGPIVRMYNQMTEPRYVIAMGACACGGGPFKEGYNVVDGIDKLIPVDVYIPGCPPTPQALLDGYIALFKKIEAQSYQTAPWNIRAPSESVPEPLLGPDLIDPRQLDQIRAAAESAGQDEEPET